MNSCLVVKKVRLVALFVKNVTLSFSAHLLPESIHILLWLNCYTIGPCIIWVVQSSLWVLADLSQQLVLWS